MYKNNSFQLAKPFISNHNKWRSNRSSVSNCLNEEYWFGKNIVTNGVLFLTTEVNSDSVDPLVAAIIEYNLMDKEDQPKHLTLYINSPGGYLHSAYHLIDSIKQSTIPIHTVAMGEVASAGVMILMSGAKNERYISENCSVMSHQFSGGVEGKEHEIAAATKDLALTTQKILTHYKKCTRKSETYIRKHLLQKSDSYFTPEEAVQHGIADKIIKT
jgi:ATP-dependent Clp protease protease subunit